MDRTSTLHNPGRWAENITHPQEEILSETLTETLINRFNQEGISYCHWKSNIDLAKTLEGKLDIDLLVSNNSLSRATEILMDLGFKPAASKWGPNPTGIFHYYGFDAKQDDLIHLHMYTRVLTGESFLKSHLLPFEEMLLGNTCSHNGLAVTSKEAELVLFVLRMFIKYGSFLDAIRLLKSDKKVQEEARWLKDGSNMEQVAILLEKYCPVVSQETFDTCLNAILPGARYPIKWTLARQIRQRLRIYRKYSFPGWFVGYVQLLTGTFVKKIRKQKGSKIFESGGAIIAIVGADATGKSTLVSETSRWLRRNFVVNTVHAGKPPSTLLTAPVNFLLNLYRKLRRGSQPLKGQEKSFPTNAGVVHAGGQSLNSLIYAIRAVCLAWDRRDLLLKIRRASSNGEIAVCDRYPTQATGMMDSPRLLEAPNRRGLISAIYNRLARMERNIYRQIPPPDIVIRLRVSLETARQRNATRKLADDDIYLQTRHHQAKEWFIPGTRSIQNIDTDFPLDETLLTVKQAIWSSL
jgi:thymidylate kinase